MPPAPWTANTTNSRTSSSTSTATASSAATTTGWAIDEEGTINLYDQNGNLTNRLKARKSEEKANAVRINSNAPAVHVSAGHR
jgi:hypothetical protein